MNLNKHIVVLQKNTEQLFRANYFPLMHINISWCVFHLCIAQPSHYTLHSITTPTQTVETVWRRQIINTQGGVIHFHLSSVLWSEGGLGWGVVLSYRDGWPWHQFPVSLFPVPPTAPSSLLPANYMTIAALWPGSQVESLHISTSMGLSRQWA